jgi:hypothetical protein
MIALEEGAAPAGLHTFFFEYSDVPLRYVFV